MKKTVEVRSVKYCTLHLTRGSPVDDASCIFLWDSSIKELCCVVRRVRCCVISCLVQSATREVLRDKLPGATCREVHSAISYVVTLFKVTRVRWRCCAISYVVTLFEVTGVRCKTLEGVRAKRKRPKPPLCLSWTQPLCLSWTQPLCLSWIQPLCSARRASSHAPYAMTARRVSSHAPYFMAFSICRNVYV